MQSQRRRVADSIAVSIAGASGYSGLELTRLLLNHPRVRLEALFANTSAGKRIGDVAPWFRTRLDKRFEEYSPDAACKSDLVVLALPSGQAMNLVPELLKRGKRVIDLGGDFRFTDASVYEHAYDRGHASPDLLADAVYGLPEWNAQQIGPATLVANPGCYPTSAILPLAPLLAKDCIEPRGIAVSSMSGVSGAGRSASASLSFVEVNETTKAYKVGIHQHNPEISSILGKLSGLEVIVTFVPHLVPISRGILTTIFATVRPGITGREILDAYASSYADAPFVRVVHPSFPEVKDVNGSNFIDIGFHVDASQQRLIVVSAIDNLLKGAAGQAVQNMNIMFGFDETEGLR